MESRYLVSYIRLHYHAHWAQGRHTAKRRRNALLLLCHAHWHFRIGILFEQCWISVISKKKMVQNMKVVSASRMPGISRRRRDWGGDLREPPVPLKHEIHLEPNIKFLLDFPILSKNSLLEFLEFLALNIKPINIPSPSSFARSSRICIF